MAERYKVDVALSMMPWNYTNTTGNFRRVVQRIGSKRLKVMWGPADNLNSGEWDVATAGFQNIRPYLYGLHLKDLHVVDGVSLKFEYRPLGDGDVDYLSILRNLRDHCCDAVLSLSTHFLPPSGSRIEAMRINHANLKKLIERVEAEA
jgi:sugar phosphate isomerase/epimerase